MKTTNYYEQRSKLREAAIADIRTYVEKNGETFIRNMPRLGYEGYRLRIHSSGKYLWIGANAIGNTSLYELCIIADMLNQMP